VGGEGRVEEGGGDGEEFTVSTSAFSSFVWASSLSLISLFASWHCALPLLLVFTVLLSPAVGAGTDMGAARAQFWPRDALLAIPRDTSSTCTGGQREGGSSRGRRWIMIVREVHGAVGGILLAI
jgi:hypothetical protein